MDPHPHPHPRRRRLGRAVMAGGLAVAGSLLTASGAASAPPEVVDPATVTPALNSNFAPWSCVKQGQGIRCDGDWEPSYSEPIGLQCEGQDVWITGEGREVMTRWHTAEGLATRTLVRLEYPGDVFSFDPALGGAELVVSGQFQRSYSYPVPGDLASRVLTEKGLIYLGKVDGQVVFVDAGTVQFAPGQDFDVITTMHGRHDLYEDPGLIDRVICETLT